MEFNLERVSVEYNGIPAVNNVTLSFDGKGVMVLTGATGAGKTTLLKMLYGSILPTNGSVNIDGISTSKMSRGDLRVLRRNLGVVQQNCRLVSDYTVFENVLMPYAVAGRKRLEAEASTMALLTDLNISYVKHKLPRQLSGGEQHLVALARALAMKPAMIIADEPTGTLDDGTTNEVAAALQRAVGEGAGLIVSTHSEHFRSKFQDATQIHLIEGVVQ